MNEIFKEITGYENYLISNTGLVKTKSRQGTNERLLKGSVDHTGYLRVNLINDKGSRSFAVHRLVCLMFIPNPENKRTVNHIDGNKLNNCLSNLEWMTHSENHRHAYDVLNRTTHMKGKSGSLHPNGKKVMQICKTTGSVVIFDTLRLAAQSGNFQEGHISACCHNRRKSHGGYYWKFKEDFVGPEVKLQAILDERNT